MKTTSSYPPVKNAHFLNENSGFRQPADLSNKSRTFPFLLKKVTTAFPALKTELGSTGLLTVDAATEIKRGSIPNLEQVCLDLYHTIYQQSTPYSALQFVPVLKELMSIDQGAIDRFIENPKTSHILLQNALLKVVLIHWKPGKMSSIHGHPQGGCVFKILQGTLQEKRYSPDESQRLLAVSTLENGGIAYIDDNMAFHAVGNPFSTSAISLHVYTPGSK